MQLQNVHSRHRVGCLNFSSSDSPPSSPSASYLLSHLLDDELYLKVGCQQRGAPIVHLKLRAAIVTPQYHVYAGWTIKVELHLLQGGILGWNSRRKDGDGKGRPRRKQA